MFRSLQQHPFLLINGVANTVYYFAESMLYREPLGLVFLVPYTSVAGQVRRYANVLRRGRVLRWVLGGRYCDQGLP